jgi:transketolase
VEAGASAGWWKYVGAGGAVVGIDRFGESGPMEELFEEMGFTPERLARVVRGVARAGRAERSRRRRPAPARRPRNQGR